MEQEFLEIISGILEHIEVLNDDYTQLAVDVGVLKSQMSMVLKLQWAVVIVVGGFVITKILTTVFNNKIKN